MFLRRNQRKENVQVKNHSVAKFVKCYIVGNHVTVIWTELFCGALCLRKNSLGYIRSSKMEFQ